MIGTLRRVPDVVEVVVFGQGLLDVLKTLTNKLVVWIDLSCQNPNQNLLGASFTIVDNAHIVVVSEKNVVVWLPLEVLARK